MEADLSFKADIADYEIGSIIGIGSFGKVVLAKNKVSGHEYAVKIIDKTVIPEEHLFTLKNEIKILTMLSKEPEASEYMSKYYGYFETEVYIYIFMGIIWGVELMRG